MNNLLLNLFCLLSILHCIVGFKSKVKKEIEEMFAKNDPFLRTERSLGYSYPKNDNYLNEHAHFPRASLLAQEADQGINEINDNKAVDQQTNNNNAESGVQYENNELGGAVKEEKVDTGGQQNEIVTGIQPKEENIIDGQNENENNVDIPLVSASECYERVHRKCVQIEYTEEEVENVRLYLAKRFRNTNPVKPLCKRLYVRKDIKCLTDSELSQLIRAYRQLYRKGVIDRYSMIHAAYWPATHKFAEGLPWHRWHVRQLEKELQRINPRIALPYWELYSEFAAPERSRIWDVLGRAGDTSNNFCIPSGAFAYTSVAYPKPHCITRQWNRDGTITPWESPEWVTSATQVAKNWTQYVNMIGFTAHFKHHLSIGGFYGDYSIPWATNDPAFYILHAFAADLILLKWQLSNDEYLVPQSYSGNNRLLPRSQRIVLTNIETDTLAYYSKTKIKEAFQVGFGELCYIHDQLIRPINDIVHGIEREQPIAIKILMESLPKATLVRHFPKFVDNTYTAFDHFFPDIGHCSLPQSECPAIPIALRYNETANGLRQLERFRLDGRFDVTPMTFQAETLYYAFMNDLRLYQYCSPYIT